MKVNHNIVLKIVYYTEIRPKNRDMHLHQTLQYKIEKHNLI